MRQTILLPAYVGLAVLLACVLALLAALVAAPAAPAATTDSDVWFLVRCDYSHRLSDDPIVYFGKQGASHSHDFFGNKTTNYNSTYESMSKPDTPTTCSRPKDTAGYWFPTVSWNGKELTPNRANFYYRAAADKDLASVKPFAADLRMITSNARWYCGIDDTKVGTLDPPTTCKNNDPLGVRIVFPDCVAQADPTDPDLKDVDDVVPGNNYKAGAKIDPATGYVIDPATGQVIDSPNHKSHMAVSRLQDGTRSCPDTPDTQYILVPRLTLNANFPVPKPTGTVTLSSGAASTMHADFWNTWDQQALKDLVVDCIKNGTPGKHPLECRSPTGK